MSANNNQQQQPAGQPRQPVSYPSPTYGGSPSMGNTQYNYPAPNVQGEQYRDSSTGSNASMSLPSMQAMTSSLGGPVGGGPYYQSLSHPSSYPNVTSDPTGQNMRFALPQQGDARVMSGGRHKKVSATSAAAAAAAAAILDGLRVLLIWFIVVGDQASHQDWMLDLPQAQNQGKLIIPWPRRRSEFEVSRFRGFEVRSACVVKMERFFAIKRFRSTRLSSAFASSLLKRENALISFFCSS